MYVCFSYIKQKRFALGRINIRMDKKWLFVGIFVRTAKAQSPIPLFLSQ
ncbi:hypothetical protein PORCRE_3 [Porphyromonas crevioricanis JCM 15906]|uniref:Uncharacterized protein n=1 Tax=Porphyromonas crevioricanis JCM 15906 TaxID=1305617 RepID=S4N8Z1_9PORP|nr:hypothetical protein PORCRE_3 [Porphyromonas crevioricanis JCM 15906]GAD08495.1 hypothetical protein PORCAN_2143 [Porphyromonas crevioricanis JCM 13913]